MNFKRNSSIVNISKIKFYEILILLNEDQKQFLDKYKIPISGVFNATGIPRKNYNKIMKELGKYIEVGVTQCKKLTCYITFYS